MPADLYASALVAHASSDAGDATAALLHLRYADGAVAPLAIGRWCGEPDDVDRDLLDRCLDPTLDVGCGPGRLVAALCAAGRPALGVDVTGIAVSIARAAGAEAVRRSVFDPLPDEGRWRSVLLADGNIGIGGAPVRLLRRCAELLAPDGHVLVELDPPGSVSAAVEVRLESAHDHSEWFTWAHVAADQIDVPARESGLRIVDHWMLKGRWFASLAP